MAESWLTMLPSQHQAEKQYVCQWCQNRFKNKNEAERHQNSLHLRRHSWSCATLENYEAAFHRCTMVPPNTGSTQSPQQVPLPQTQTSQLEQQDAPYDVCGYCGQQFSNLPERNWVERSQHLTSEHKFGECNQSKKFYRADHFRQHLKHSHGGTSGKWTNMLEAACMKEEPLPEPQGQALQQSGEPQRRSPQKDFMPSSLGRGQTMPLSQLQTQQLQGAPMANMARPGSYGGGNEGQYTATASERLSRPEGD